MPAATTRTTQPVTEDKTPGLINAPPAAGGVADSIGGMRAVRIKTGTAHRKKRADFMVRDRRSWSGMRAARTASQCRVAISATVKQVPTDRKKITGKIWGLVRTNGMSNATKLAGTQAYIANNACRATFRFELEDSRKLSRGSWVVTSAQPSVAKSAPTIRVPPKLKNRTLNTQLGMLKPNPKANTKPRPNPKKGIANAQTIHIRQNRTPNTSTDWPRASLATHAGSDCDKRSPRRDNSMGVPHSGQLSSVGNERRS